MCAFCKRGWHERYPVESTLGGKASMELSTQWDAGRDVLAFNVYGSGGGRRCSKSIIARCAGKN